MDKLDINSIKKLIVSFHSKRSVKFWILEKHRYDYLAYSMKEISDYLGDKIKNDHKQKIVDYLNFYNQLKK